MMQIDKEKERLQVLTIIVVAFVFMVTVAIIAFVIHQTEPSVHDNPSVTPIALAPPKLPSGWETYVSKAQAFSIGHLSDFTPQESAINVNVVEKAASRDGFEVKFERPGTDMYANELAPLLVKVTNQTLDQAVAGRKALVTESGPNFAIIGQIILQKSLTIAGHAAVRIDEKDVDQTIDQDKLPIAYTTYIFVEGNKQIYTLQTTSQKQNALDESMAQTMLQSFVINKKSS
ncbi:MAG: hypothetical protein JWO07_566 [Candidatus Saccharibacteria bacterium]|nr:hypothetical protein [Candidatus Saccharibacteria bacterium]